MITEITIDTDNLDILETSDFYYKEFNKGLEDDSSILKEFEKDIMRLTKCSKEEAQDYLDETKTFLGDSEIAHELEFIRAKAAKACGYDAVQEGDRRGHSLYVLEMCDDEEVLQKVA